MGGLSAGDLDREVTLQVATFTPDTSGDPVPTWTTEEANLPAQWLPGGTKEAWQAQQRLGSYVDGVFRIYDRDPRPTPDTHRIIFDGKTFDVKPSIEIGRSEGLEIPVVARGE